MAAGTSPFSANSLAALPLSYNRYVERVSTVCTNSSLLHDVQCRVYSRYCIKEDSTCHVCMRQDRTVHARSKKILWLPESTLRPPSSIDKCAAFPHALLSSCIAVCILQHRVQDLLHAAASCTCAWDRHNRQCIRCVPAYANIRAVSFWTGPFSEYVNEVPT